MTHEVLSRDGIWSVLEKAINKVGKPARTILLSVSSTAKLVISFLSRNNLEVLCDCFPLTC